MIVQRLGPALAVLLTGVDSDQAEHDRLASEALSAATGLHDLTVTRRPSGRPRLAAPFRELGVSLSYRDGLLLVGFSAEHDVGADIELANGLGASDPARMARDHFTPAEAEEVARRLGADAHDLFLRLWVAKEAALKVTGRGVYDGLGEPDLATHIAAARQDLAAIRLAASSRLPELALAVWRPVLPGRPIAPYCALAWAA